MQTQLIEFKKDSPNERYPALKNAKMYIAGDVNQFQSSRIRKSLKPKLFSLDTLSERDRGDILFSNDIILSATVSVKNLFRQDGEEIQHLWFKYKDLDSRSVYHTFSYLFEKFKKGIFVRIANNTLETFLPFNNMSYKNEFSDRIKVDPKWASIPAFLNDVSRKKGYRNKQIILPTNEWVANNALVRFEKRTDEDGANILVLQNMFETLCKNRVVPDVEFFINKRDFPLLKKNGTEPYNHMYDSKHVPLLSHNYDTFSPILSGSVSDEYADVAFPTYEDWSRALYQAGVVFPDEERTWPVVESRAWSEKKPKAIFRGSSTGAGVTENTNKRLKALAIATLNSNLLDVELSWNLRPRKYEGEPFLQTIERESYPPMQRKTLQEQSEYKYILNIEGHVAAYRLSYELSSGSVILLVESEWKMWYQYKLRPYFHYVPVEADLSNLTTQIEWCISNDEKCKRIADNATLFYKKYLGPQGILDFCQVLLWGLVDTTGVYDYYPDLITWSVDDEMKQLQAATKPLKFYNVNVVESPRSIGFLDGLSQILQQSSLKRIRKQRHLFKNVNGTIDVYIMNNIPIVGKKAFSPEKDFETIHETYIGLYGINTIVGKIPNFTYMFGSKTLDGTSITFSEFIPGPTFFQWLRSPQYNFVEMVSIMIQINLALTMAQNMIGFIHRDLFPWNVVLKPLDNETFFDYILNHKTVVTFRAKRFIPMFIDYGKSRCIVYEEKYGLIDHGYDGLYDVNGIVDTLTILYASISTVQDKLSLQELQLLLEFPKHVNLPHYRDVKYWSKFGNLYRFKKSFRPRHFVDFMVGKYPAMFQNIVLKKRGDFSYPLENGHAIFTESQALGLNPYIEVIKHVDRHSTANTTNALFQRIATDIFQRRSKWFNIMVKNNAHADSLWTQLMEKMLTIKQGQQGVSQVLNTPTIISDSPTFEYPQPPELFIDEEISPRMVNETSLQHNGDNWAQVINLYLEAYIFGVVSPKDDFFEALNHFLSMDPFLYLNAIAAHNTLLKIKESIPIISSEPYKEHFEMYGGGAGAQEYME